MGCTIGDHCVIGAGAVVPQFTTVPDWSIVVGVPGVILEGAARRLADSPIATAEEPVPLFLVLSSPVYNGQESLAATVDVVVAALPDAARSQLVISMTWRHRPDARHRRSHRLVVRGDGGSCRPADKRGHGTGLGQRLRAGHRRGHHVDPRGWRIRPQ